MVVGAHAPARVGRCQACITKMHTLFIFMFSLLLSRGGAVW